MADAWSALADPTRRKILQLLSHKDMTAGDIADNFDMAKPSISHHLNILKNANLVESTKKGQNVIYSINTTVVQDLFRVFSDFINVNKKENDWYVAYYNTKYCVSVFCNA